jgi:8-oxo-dGTP diphosphatase
MAERTPRQLSPGFWELPGGKVDPGESAEQAAVRELQEEVGIRALKVRPWLRYEHAFRLQRIRLHCFKVDLWEGSPQGLEGQRIAWIDPTAPSVSPLLPSVDRILNGLGLPPQYVVCRSADHGGAGPMLVRLIQAVRCGMYLFQLWEPDMLADQRVALSRRINSILAPAGARILLAGSSLEARRAGIAGVHSSAQELRRLRARPPVKLWTCSCHDENDVELAGHLGADAAVVSPILASPAHPDTPPLGWERFEKMSRQSRLPLYAQGGVGAGVLERAQLAGAIGVAAPDWTNTAASLGSASVNARHRL